MDKKWEKNTYLFSNVDSHNPRARGHHEHRHSQCSLPPSLLPVADGPPRGAQIPAPALRPGLEDHRDRGPRHPDCRDINDAGEQRLDGHEDADLSAGITFLFVGHEHSEGAIDHPCLPTVHELLLRTAEQKCCGAACAEEKRKEGT